MKINYYQIGKEHLRIKKKYFKKINNIFYSGEFINSNSNFKFEKKISKLLNVKYVCGVANGSDALEIALQAIGVKKGDEVITPTNSWVSSLNSIINIGATPVLVDVNGDFNIDVNQIKKAIRKRTKAIMPVHLNGFPANMLEITRIAKKFKIKIVEDSAQSIMSKIGDKYTGTIGNIGCFSMHPTKNLGVAGDGGFITTNNKRIFKRVKLISNHGQDSNGNSVIAGRNSRLDAIQAELILNKIKFLKEDINRLNQIANKYTLELKNYVSVPFYEKQPNFKHTYHRYVIMLKNKKQRDNLKKYLQEKKIETKIHYLKPLHKYNCFKKYSYKKRLINAEKQSKIILSIPCNHFMSDKEVNYVIKNIKKFFKK